MTRHNIIAPLGVQGHRGARGLFPENTLEGFRSALAMGIHDFELDVGMTADGVVVLAHDPALNPDITRDATGAWLAGRPPLLRDLTLAELATYDVGRIRPGTGYAARFPDQAPHDGARVPTLAAVLRLDPAVRFTIELKTSPPPCVCTVAAAELADAALAEIDAAGAAARVIVESFDWRGPRHIRRTRPDIRLAWLTSARTVHDAGRWWDGPRPADFSGSVPRAVAAEGGPIWAPDYTDLTLEQLAEAHDLGLLVLPWTVNDPVAMSRLLRWGADGLITDRPDLVPGS